MKSCWVNSCHIYCLFCCFICFSFPSISLCGGLFYAGMSYILTYYQEIFLLYLMSCIEHWQSEYITHVLSYSFVDLLQYNFNCYFSCVNGGFFRQSFSSGGIHKCCCKSYSLLSVCVSFFGIFRFSLMMYFFSCCHYC